MTGNKFNLTNITKEAAMIQPNLSRRNFLKVAGLGAASLAGIGGVAALKQIGISGKPARLVANSGPVRRITLAFTDGWVSMPAGTAPFPPFFPDAGAANVPGGAPGEKFTTWVMGIRDITGFEDRPYDFKGMGQISAPLIYSDEGDQVHITLINLGMKARPDLFDSHTVHWHGFPNQIAYFDGVPDASLSAPPNGKLEYEYIPLDPGTYMYHCHVEDVEHVHMGLTGLLFVRPALNKTPQVVDGALRGKFAYNDPSTWYDREHAIFLSDIWQHAHWNDAHTQDTDWTDFNADFRLFNGRAYPDTVEPNNPQWHPSDGRNTFPAPGYTNGRLMFQPMTSLIQGNAGERVLIRLANLAYEEHSLMLPGLPFKVVGRDAKQQTAGRPQYLPAPGLGGRATYPSGAQGRGDISTMTTRVDIGPGESRDLIVTLPSSVTPDPGKPYKSFAFYDRNYGFNLAKGATPANGLGYGGMRTEIRVYPAGTLPPQPEPNA